MSQQPHILLKLRREDKCVINITKDAEVYQVTQAQMQDAAEPTVTRQRRSELHDHSVPYLVGSSVETWNLSGAFQEATAALGQMLAHPSVQRRDAARQTSPGVKQCS